LACQRDGWRWRDDISNAAVLGRAIRKIADRGVGLATLFSKDWIILHETRRVRAQKKLISRCC
jgi:hypothetical protein